MSKKSPKKNWFVRLNLPRVTKDNVERLRSFRDKIRSEKSTIDFMFGTSPEASYSTVLAGSSIRLAVDEIDKLINMAEEILDENEISS